MKFPTKALLIGCAVAASVAAIGFGYEYHLGSKVSRLEAQCIEESKRGSPAAAFGKNDALVCDRDTLAELPESVGIQAEIVAAHRKAKHHDDWYYGLAIGVLIFSSLPYLWYFLLQRIRELRNAIMGD